MLPTTDDDFIVHGCCFCRRIESRNESIISCCICGINSCLKHASCDGSAAAAADRSAAEERIIETAKRDAGTRLNEGTRDNEC